MDGGYGTFAEMCFLVTRLGSGDKLNLKLKHLVSEYLLLEEFGGAKERQ
jgi:hypothetical protein